jgi:hypothetical protein
MPRYLHPLLDQAKQWWSSLSINQMKDMAAKYHGCLSYHHVLQVDSRMVETYEAEHGLEHKDGIYY